MNLFIIPRSQKEVHMKHRIIILTIFSMIIVSPKRMLFSLFCVDNVKNPHQLLMYLKLMRMVFFTIWINMGSIM